MAVIRNKGNYISNDRFGINCNSRHLAGSHPKKVDCQAKVVPSLFTGYGPLDRQESGRILCQDRICHHHS